MKCVYCELKEIKERKTTENDFAWAFPTNIPITKGHMLIVPKRCLKNIEQCTEEELKDIFKLVNKIKKALRNVYGAEGFNIAWNEEKIAGQSVPHFHIHIVPRKEGDTGILPYDPRKFLYRPGDRDPSDEKELQEISSEIRKGLE